MMDQLILHSIGKHQLESVIGFLEEFLEKQKAFSSIWLKLPNFMKALRSRKCDSEVEIYFQATQSL